MGFPIRVTIEDQTRPIPQRAFGIPLILGDTKEEAYAEYEDLAAVGEAYGASDPEYLMASRIFGQTPRVDRIAIRSIERSNEDPDPEELTEALSELIEAHNSWYFLLSTGREAVLGDTAALASFAAGANKLFVAGHEVTATAEVLADRAGTINSRRTGIIAHTNPALYADAGLVGKIAPFTPGSRTWKFKTIDGVGAADWTTAQVSLLKAGNVIPYINRMGVAITDDGKATDGSFLDITQIIDYLTARIQESTFGLMVNHGKIPYDDTGIALVSGSLRAVLQAAFADGLIADDGAGNGMFEVTAPARADVPANTRANRILPDIRFRATVAGAVHEVEVEGVLEV